MNNGLLIEELEVKIDTLPLLRQRETELVDIITAVETLAESKEWVILKLKVFDGLVESLQKRLQSEATNTELNNPEIYRLNGQLAWAKKYADFKKLADAYRVELSNIRKKLNG